MESSLKICDNCVERFVFMEDVKSSLAFLVAISFVKRRFKNAT